MTTTGPSFEITTDPEAEIGETLVIATTNVGLAGVTAAEYLLQRTENDRVGRITSRRLPDITPFTDGEPRHPMRVYTLTDADVSVLVSEVFVPVSAAEALADAIVDWVGQTAVSEVDVLHAVPYPHGPDEHAVFHVGTPTFRERRIGEHDIRPLSGGFFDGLPGELLLRSVNGELPPTGVLTTPAHPPGPDFESALLFLDAIETLFGLAVDEDDLRTQSAATRQYLEELADRMQAIEEGGRDRSEDRMFM